MKGNAIRSARVVLATSRRSLGCVPARRNRWLEKPSTLTRGSAGKAAVEGRAAASQNAYKVTLARVCGEARAARCGEAEGLVCRQNVPSDQGRNESLREAAWKGLFIEAEWDPTIQPRTKPVLLVPAHVETVWGPTANWWMNSNAVPAEHATNSYRALISLSAQVLLAQGAPPHLAADQPYSDGVLLQGSVGASAGIPAALPEKSLPAAAEKRGERAHAFGED